MKNECLLLSTFSTFQTPLTTLTNSALMQVGMMCFGTDKRTKTVILRIGLDSDCKKSRPGSKFKKIAKKYDNLCNRNQKSLTNSYLLPNVLGFIWPLAPIGTALVPKKVILATIFVCRWVLGYWEQCTVWKDHRQAGAIIVQWTANYLPLSSAPMRV